MPVSGGIPDASSLRAQLGAAYDRYDAAAQRRHAEMVAEVRSPADVALRAEAPGERHWTVTVSTADRVGALSLMAGLFTVYRADIVSADIFTLNFEQPRDPTPPVGLVRGRQRRRRRRRPRGPVTPSRKVLDIFEVRTVAGAEAAPWGAFRDDLAALLTTLDAGDAEAARERVIDRVSDVVRETPERDARLMPVEIELDNDSSPDATRLSIRSSDTLGFLFEFTNTLALLRANIDRAEIRATGDEANDTFWLTDAAGRKITDAERLRHLRVAAALIKQFTHLLPHSPNPSQALRQFSALTGQMLSRPDWADELRNLESGAVLETLAGLMGVSRFLWEDFLRIQHGNLFPVLVDTPALAQPAATKDALRAELRRRIAAVDGYSARAAALNEFKDREMFRIDLRHLTAHLDLVAFSRELSELAEVVVEETAEIAHRATASRFDAGARRQPWCICALGKFGGTEMGFASDVELIFVHGGSGRGGEASAGYFEEFVRTFLGTLHVHRQGIFEVDLRLRPHGNAGPLAISLDGLRRYLAEGGGAQQFERMALVKLRPVAGDEALGREVGEVRDGFVYSGRPLDVDNILHLRERQMTELVPAGVVNAKYSAGGVVDVEYFVQALQITAGRDDAGVRVTGTLDAIDRLEAGGHLPAPRAAALRSAYGFLRRLIDALRVVRGNARDLAIPPAGSREFAYLARRLDYPDAARLERAIEQQMAVASAVWSHAGTPRPHG